MCAWSRTLISCRTPKLQSLQQMTNRVTLQQADCELHDCSASVAASMHWNAALYSISQLHHAGCCPGSCSGESYTGLRMFLVCQMTELWAPGHPGTHGDVEPPAERGAVHA